MNIEVAGTVDSRLLRVIPSENLPKIIYMATTIIDNFNHEMKLFLENEDWGQLELTINPASKGIFAMVHLGIHKPTSGQEQEHLGTVIGFINNITDINVDASLLLTPELLSALSQRFPALVFLNRGALHGAISVVVSNIVVTV